MNIKKRKKKKDSEKEGYLHKYGKVVLNAEAK